MQLTVTLKPRQAARREIVKQMEPGVSVREARMNSAVPMHRTTVYRLLKRVQSEGERALTDGRHGHPIKLRGEVLIFLTEYCQSDPSVSSSAMQRLLQDRFGLCISVSQLNRVRASLRLSRKLLPQEKKSPKSPYRLNQDTTNKRGGCCYWPLPPRLGCSRSYVKPCQQK